MICIEVHDRVYIGGTEEQGNASSLNLKCDDFDIVPNALSSAVDVEDEPKSFSNARRRKDWNNWYLAVKDKI